MWQEFVFACSRYPTTDLTFFTDAQAEATYNVRRLASHPSLIAWCGNNEIRLARRLLGYEPKMSLDAGLLELAEWLESQSAKDRLDHARQELDRRGLAI